MTRVTGLGLLGATIFGILSLLGSDHWLTAGYGASDRSIARSTGGDEAYWLARGRLRGVEPASATAAVEAAGSRAFGIGTRLVIAGSERLTLDVVSAVPAASNSGLVDGSGRPLIIVTARERGTGTRMVRILVEADRAPPLTEKSL